jgi:chorismate synthase
VFELRKSIGGLSDNAIQFVVLAVTLGIGATILGNIQADQVTNTLGCNSTVTTNCGFDFNASQNGLQAVDTFASNIGTLALVIVFGIILFFLGRFLVSRRS